MFMGTWRLAHIVAKQCVNYEGVSRRGELIKEHRDFERSARSTYEEFI